MKKIYMVFAMAILFLSIFSTAQVSAQNIAPFDGTLVCTNLTNTLFIGSRDAWTGGEVTKLQAFLNSTHYLNYPPTGYFGALTFGAVKQFQHANGIIPIGVVGPVTRAKIQSISCGTVQNNTPTLYSISPTAGPIGTQVTITGSGFNNTTTIKFGSGSISNISYINQSTIRFTIPDYIGQYCAPGMYCTMLAQQVTPGVYPISVSNGFGLSNTLNFTVTSGTTTTPSISSITPSFGAVGTSVTIYGNGFTYPSSVIFTNGNLSLSPTVQYINNSQLSFTVPSTTNYECFAAPCNQQPVTPGVYSVSVQNNYGTSNAYNFTVTSSGSSGQLSITGLDAPATLSVGTTGTWTIHASIPPQGNLHYSVVWGDEVYTPYASITAPTQTTFASTVTFSHRYMQSEMYTIRFTITDDYGHSVMTTTTATVTPLY